MDTIRRAWSRLIADMTRGVLFLWEDRRGRALVIVLLVLAIALRCTFGPVVGQ